MIARFLLFTLLLLSSLVWAIHGKPAPMTFRPRVARFADGCITNPNVDPDSCTKSAPYPPECYSCHSL